MLLTLSTGGDILYNYSATAESGPASEDTPKNYFAPPVAKLVVLIQLKRRNTERHRQIFYFIGETRFYSYTYIVV